MGKFYTARFLERDGTGRYTQVSDWFNALDGISSEVVTLTVDNIEFIGAKVIIDNTNIEMYMGNKPNAITNSYGYIKNDDVTLCSKRTTGGAEEIGVTVSAYIDEKCIILSITQNVNGMELIYTKTSNNKYLIGYYVNLSGNITILSDISNFTFNLIGDESRAPYTYTNMFPFYAMPGTLDFLNMAYFKNSLNYKSFTSNILKECSTVTLLDSVSLPGDLGQHLAIGAHCIVPIDSDEEVSE